MESGKPKQNIDDLINKLDKFIDRYSKNKQLVADFFDALNKGENKQAYETFKKIRHCHTRNEVILAANKHNCNGLVSSMLDNIVDINTSEENGNTLLHRAIIEKRIDLIKTLLSRSDINVNVKDSSGYTSLHCASILAEINAPEIILIGSPNDATSNDHCVHAIDETVIIKQKDIIQLLISDSRADPNVQDIHGCSPMHFIADSGDRESMRTLLSHPKIDISVTDHNGDTPCDFADQRGHTHIIEMLLEKGACLYSERAGDTSFQSGE